MTEKRLNIDLIEDLFVREELIRLYEENEQLNAQKLNTEVDRDYFRTKASSLEDGYLQLQDKEIRLKKEIEQLKQQLFETSKELLWATSDEVDRALHYEDEVEELRKEIFE